MPRKRGGKPGKPTKLTPETSDKIIALSRAGNFRETACAATGIDSRTLRIWLKRGAAEPDSIYAKFAAELNEAEAYAEGMGVAAITEAGAKDWRALAWWLEKKFQARWGGKQQLELSGPGGGPIQTSAVIFIPPEDKD